MTTADIVTALNTAFDASGLDITAEAAGAEVLLTHGAYGSAAGISVLNTGAGDGTSELWAAAATNYGINVQGTIGGHAATGAGQQLVANAGTPVAGMIVRFDGTTPGAAGTVGLTVGAGASVERLLDSFLQASTGSVAHRETSLRDRAAKLDARAAMLESRLEGRRAAMMRRFVHMESAIARLQKQSQSLAAMSGFQSASTK
jgi:flagellar hook-associated protein 2